MLAKKTSFVSSSQAQTEELGMRLAKEFITKKTFLFGDLGVGKTTFLRGLAKALKIKTKIKSPTFVGERIHKIPSKGNLIHLDLYRDESLEVEKKERLRELFASREMVVVEWSERIPKSLLPKKRIEVRFRELKNEARRVEVKVFR